jgi:peptidoglycan/LPS O-acetylase OafA/YrhL
MDTAADIRSNRLPSLTGMRFCAAFLVFLCHSSVQGFFADTGLQGTLQTLFVRAGWAGVQFFFILSGFVLTWSSRPGDTVTAFWRRRAVKLVPNNVVTCVLALVLILAAGQALTAQAAIPNFFMVQSWVPNFTVFNGLNPPSWSLCCEALFYALFPLLVRLVNRIPPRLLWWAAGGLLAFILIMPLVATVLPAHPLLGITPPTSFPRFWLVYAFPVTRVADFTIGIVLARIVITGKWIRIGLLPATLIAVACYALTVVAPVLYSTVATMTVGLALLIGAGATADITGLPSPLRGRRMLWLGEISFAFYMVHMLVLIYGHLAIGNGAYSVPVAIAVDAGLFVVALGCAALLYTFVERPAMRRFSRKRIKTADLIPVG